MFVGIEEQAERSRNWSARTWNSENCVVQTENGIDENPGKWIIEKIPAK